MSTLSELEHDVRELARMVFMLRGTVPPTFVVFADEAMWSLQVLDPEDRDAAIGVVRQLIREHDGDAVALFSYGSSVIRGVRDPAPTGPVMREKDNFRCLFVYVETREGKRVSMAPVKNGQPGEWVTDPRMLLVPLRVPEFFGHMRN